MDTQDFHSNIIQDITKEDIAEIEKEPGDINDIAQEIPEKEKLDKLKNLIDTMSREDISQLLSELGNVNDGNPINPNGNKFSTSSQKEMRRRKYKMMLEMKKKQRLTSFAKKKLEEKNKESFENNSEKQDEVIDVADDGDRQKFSINGMD